MTRFAKVKPDTMLYKGLKGAYDAFLQWPETYKAICSMLEVEPLNEYYRSAKELVITQELYSKLSGAQQLAFRNHPKTSDGYTPRMNTREGKAIDAAFRKIIKEHGVNVMSASMVIPLSGFSMYKGMKHFCYKDEVYISWEQANDVPEDMLDDITHTQWLEVELERAKEQEAKQEVGSSS